MWIKFQSRLNIHSYYIVPVIRYFVCEVYYFLIFWGAYSLIKGPTFITFLNFSMGYGYFQVLRLFCCQIFKALRLFFLPHFPAPTFTPCPTSIPDCRVAAEILPEMFE